MSEERVHFASGPLRLEGRLSLPSHPSTAAVLCHPHPQYGGSMDNNVIDAVVDSLSAARVATLRFNFRGVGRSEGSYGNLTGECDDARAAVAWLGERTGATAVALAGYSFGAIVALTAGYDDPAVDRLIAIAPPLSMFRVDFLAACPKPKLFLIGDADQYCSRRDFERAVAALPQPIESRLLPGADHFFAGTEDELARPVAEFLVR